MKYVVPRSVLCFAVLNCIGRHMLIKFGSGVSIDLRASALPC